LNSIDFEEKNIMNTNSSSLNSSSILSDGNKNCIQNTKKDIKMLVHTNSNFSYSNDDSNCSNFDSSDFFKTENAGPLFQNSNEKSFSSFSCSYNNSSTNDSIENNKKHDIFYKNNLTSPLKAKKKHHTESYNKNSSNNNNNNNNNKSSSNNSNGFTNLTLGTNIFNSNPASNHTNKLINNDESIMTNYTSIEKLAVLKPQSKDYILCFDTSSIDQNSSCTSNDAAFNYNISTSPDNLFSDSEIIQNSSKRIFVKYFVTETFSKSYMMGVLKKCKNLQI
jgi:hypothetical protein